MTEMNMTKATDATTVVRRYVSAVEAGDEHTVRDLFAEDATWTLAAGNLPISGTWTGREVILTDFLGAALSYYEPGSARWPSCSTRHTAPPAFTWRR